MVTHSFPLSLPGGFWSKAYIITSEEGDKVVEVAIAIPVEISTKAIPINIPCFLFILAKIRWVCADLYLANFI